MPWSIEKRGDEFCVIKDDDGEVEGCHESREKAEAQRRALYASEDEASATTDTLGGVTQSTGDFQIFPATSTWNANGGTITFKVVPVEGSEQPVESEPASETSVVMWEGVLGIEGRPTDDARYLMPGEISERELPLSLMIQTVTAEGHAGAELGGRIDEIWRVEMEDGSIEIWGRGPFDSSEIGQEGARLVEEEFLTGVSLDLAISEAIALDPETFEPLEDEEMGLLDFLTMDFVTGIKGKIMGATLVPFPAFSDAKVGVITASAMKVVRPRALVASAAPVKPPKEWFEDPHLTELTPLTITKEGRVYGHLADWDGCHIGFEGICVPPFRSASNYAHFNTGEIETAGGDLVPCGKIMFCREGNGHAPLEMNLDEASRYYDDATKVGAFVRAGSDRYGTWLAGVLRSDLDDLEIQHLRTHPPSGDWRPTMGGRGPSELIAAFAVPIGGFTIPRRALVASADGEITAIITAPLEVGENVGARRRMRKKIMLANRVQEALGYRPSSKRRMRQEALARKQEG